MTSLSAREHQESAGDSRLFLHTPPVLLPFQPGLYCPGPCLVWTQPEPGHGGQRHSRHFQLSTTSLRTSIAILALRVGEVWQDPCLGTYVAEGTHAEDLDH